MWFLVLAVFWAIGTLAIHDEEISAKLNKKDVYEQKN